MTEEEIDALLAAEDEPTQGRREARLRVADELFAFATQSANGGKFDRALNMVKLADQMARTAKRIGDLETTAEAVDANLANLGHGHEVANVGQIHINIAAAKDNLSRLVAIATTGGEVILCRHGHPTARIVPFERAEQTLLPLAGEKVARSAG